MTRTPCQQSFCKYSPAKGALTQLYAATAPEALEMNGKFLIPWARVGKVAKAAKDPELARKLWEWCEEQVKDVDVKAI